MHLKNLIVSAPEHHYVIGLTTARRSPTMPPSSKRCRIYLRRRRVIRSGYSLPRKPKFWRVFGLWKGENEKARYPSDVAFLGDLDRQSPSRERHTRRMLPRLSTRPQLAPDSTSFTLLVHALPCVGCRNQRHR